MWFGWTLLPLIMSSSALGMLTLKYSQQHGNLGALTLGYLFEALAFAVYPYSLRYHTLRVVTATWASSSILTSYVGGALLYDEIPSRSSVCGGLLMVVGLGLTSWS